MHALVEKIAKERQDHIDKIENYTLKQITEINRKSYVP